MTNFLLVHGAFRGGWSWGRVAARLTAQGHHVVAPDLLGAGSRWRPGHQPVGLTATLDDLVAQVEATGRQEWVVCGHSQGGFIAEALTQRIPERLQLVCHLDAPVPSHGERAVDLGPGGPPDQLPPADAWFPAAPLDPATVGGDRLVAATWTRRLTPLSVAIALESVVLDDPAAQAVPRTYAWCSGTPQGFPCWTTRARRAEEGHADTVLDAPHDAPLAEPGMVADWLIESASVVPSNGTAFR